MAHSPRDVETEVVDFTDFSLSEIDTLEPACLSSAISRILAAEADPADPLFGGDPPKPGVFAPPSAQGP